MTPPPDKSPKKAPKKTFNHTFISEQEVLSSKNLVSFDKAFPVNVTRKKSQLTLDKLKSELSIDQSRKIFKKRQTIVERKRAKDRQSVLQNPRTSILEFNDKDYDPNREHYDRNSLRPSNVPSVTDRTSMPKMRKSVLIDRPAKPPVKFSSKSLTTIYSDFSAPSMDFIAILADSDDEERPIGRDSESTGEISNKYLIY